MSKHIIMDVVNQKIFTKIKSWIRYGERALHRAGNYGEQCNDVSDNVADVDCIIAKLYYLERRIYYDKANCNGNAF